MIHSNNWPNWWNTINTKIRFHKTSSARMRIVFCAWDFFVIMYSSKQHKEGFMTKFSPWLYCHFCKYLSSELYFLDLQSLVDGCFLDFSLSSLTTCLAFAAKLLFSPGCSFWLLSQLFLDLATRSAGSSGSFTWSIVSVLENYHFDSSPGWVGLLNLLSPPEHQLGICSERECFFTPPFPPVNFFRQFSWDLGEFPGLTSDASLCHSLVHSHAHFLSYHPFEMSVPWPFSLDVGLTATLCQPHLPPPSTSNPLLLRHLVTLSPSLASSPNSLLSCVITWSDVSTSSPTSSTCDGTSSLILSVSNTRIPSLMSFITSWLE